MFNKVIKVSFLALAVLLTAPAFSADEYNTSTGLTAASAPLGLHGVDPVAFIQLGNRIDGQARFTAVYDNVAYYFSSEENRETFEKNPSRFVPQNGGFCTFGVSVGKKFNGNPDYAAVINDKLYVFLNEDIFKLFQKDQAGTIAKASQQWKDIRTTAATEL